jgi:hypothetical protein
VGPPASFNLATPTVIDTGSERTTLAIEYHGIRRLNLGADAGYFLGGGLGAADRQVVALQHGPYADLSATYLPVRTDSVYARASVSETDSEASSLAAPGACGGGGMAMLTQCSPSDLIATARLGWHHAASRVADGSIEVGGGYIRSRFDTSLPYMSAAYPVASALYERRFRFAEAPASLRLSVEVSPTIDLRAGSPDYRVQGSAVLVSTTRTLTWSGQVGVARSLPLPKSGVQTVLPSTFVSFITTAERSLGKYVSFGATLALVYQHQDGEAATLGMQAVNAGDLWSETASVALTVRAPPARF